MIDRSKTAGVETRDLRPESINHMQSMLRDEVPHDASISIAGGGTRAKFGNVGAPTNFKLETQGLYRVIDHSPEDLVIAVEAGVTFEKLNAVLGESGQFLPIDAAYPEQSTLGGAFATGISGPRRLKYGSLKDSVVGIEVMSPEGTVSKSGGMVVKNVSGYDLARLHYGAQGAFGIITRLNFKVRPVPEAAALIGLQVTDSAAAWDLCLSLWRSSLDLSAIYLRCSSGIWSVNMLGDGSQSKIDSLLDKVKSVARSQDFASEVSSKEVDPITPLSDLPFLNLNSERGVVRLAMPVSKQTAAVDLLLKTGCDEVYADPGSNLVYGISEPTIEWRQAILHAFDRPVFLALPADLRRGTDVTGGLEPAMEPTLSRLKIEFDPYARLNPGRGAI